MSEAVSARLSFAEYVLRERESPVRHELVDGVALAMAGGSIEHGRLASRLAWLVQRGIAGRPCDTFGSDVRVRTPSGDAYHPDLTIVCGQLERDPEDRDTLRNPSGIVEVLSHSTEARDRTTKFRRYRTIPSLREYVLVAQEEHVIEVWRRDGARWVLAQEAGPGGTVELETAGAILDVDELYRDPLAGE